MRKLCITDNTGMGSRGYSLNIFEAVVVNALNCPMVHIFLSNLFFMY